MNLLYDIGCVILETIVPGITIGLLFVVYSQLDELNRHLMHLKANLIRLEHDLKNRGPK